MTRLLLWRHGLTEWNAAGRIQGQLDAPLAEEGIRQAEKAASVLAGLEPTAIVSSDLSRARRTAEELAARTGLTVSTDVALRERHWGDWQGSTHAELQVDDPERYAAWRDGGRIEVPCAESNSAVGARAAAAIRAAASTGDTVVVVSHGGAIRYGLGELLGAPDLPRVLRTLENCRWADVRARGDRWVLHAYNVGA
ncbi:MAG TPA: histidine phosphatase family protein [Mycobacteriales bacterium]|nr:histidine phosphatase family protein [Mycobacteriales bacterium]